MPQNKTKVKTPSLPSRVGSRSLPLGCDPEFFIRTKAKGAIISADKVLPGKDNKALFGRGTAFFDGVQAEINPISHTCRESLCNNIREVLAGVYRKMGRTRESLACSESIRTWLSVFAHCELCISLRCIIRSFSSRNWLG